MSDKTIAEWETERGIEINGKTDPDNRLNQMQFEELAHLRGYRSITSHNTILEVQDMHHAHLAEAVNE